MSHIPKLAFLSDTNIAASPAQYDLLMMNGTGKWINTPRRTLSQGTGIATFTYDPVGGSNATVALNHLGIEALTSPSDNRIMFWSIETATMGWLQAGTGLSISGTTLTATGSGGTVTSISAGNGMDFTTITGSGSIILGTPSTLTGSTTNSASSTTHTHAITGFAKIHGTSPSDQQVAYWSDGATIKGNGSMTYNDSTGTLTVANLVVSGTTTTISSTTMTVTDPILTLGGTTVPTSDDNKDRGVEFRWHNGTTAKVGFFGFDDSTGKFTFIPDATNTSEVFSGTIGTLDAKIEWANVLNPPSTYAPGAHTHGNADLIDIAWSKVTGKPTTVSGYGIIDAMTTSHAANSITGFGASGSATTVARSDHDHTGVYQPVDADLTAIAGLTGTTGYLKKTASDTWTLDTSTFLTANQSITLSGDVGGTGTTSISTTVSGIKGVAVPTLTTGFLKYNGSAWTFDSTSYQSLNAELTALAGISGTGFVRRAATPSYSASAIVWADISAITGTTNTTLAVGNHNHDSVYIQGSGIQYRLAIYNGSLSMTTDQYLTYQNNTLAHKGWSPGIITISSATYTTLNSDTVIICNNTVTTTITIDTSLVSRSYFIKRINTGDVILSPNNSKLVDGASTYTLPGLYTAVMVVVDSTGNVYIL